MSVKFARNPILPGFNPDPAGPVFTSAHDPDAALQLAGLIVYYNSSKFH